MKPLNPEDQHRLDLLYGVLDKSYAGLRDFALLQRAALRQGGHAVCIANQVLSALHASASQTWAEINAIVNDSDAAATAPPAPPVPEVVN